MKVSTENDNNFGYEKITIVVDNIPLNNFWFVDKTNKDKLAMKLSGAVTISIYYLSIIHHHIHIIIYNNENHIYCPLWKETLFFYFTTTYLLRKKLILKYTQQL